MDVLYVAGPQLRGEMRYSLRSVAENLLPLGQVWVSGMVPTWVDPDVVRVVSVPQSGTKWENTTANLVAALQAPGFPEEFLLFNDDFFLLEPVAGVPPLHMGGWREWLAEKRYVTSVYTRAGREANAQLKLDGIYEPLCYELHVPMPVRRDPMLAMLKSIPKRGMATRAMHVHKRSFYGNRERIGGRAIADVKVYGADVPLPASGPYVSTSANSWRGVAGDSIRQRFPQPCGYEQEGR